MMNTFIISLIALIYTSQLQATIYVGFNDVKTGSSALAVITSGPIRRQNTIITAKNDQGLIGWSGRWRVSEKIDKGVN